jgi:predicted AlkP superfamily phosphohydrolase/phosphomutase
MTDGSTSMRTLLVGIDAACSSVLDPLFDDGATPHLRALFEDSVTADLESQIPPWTPSAWPSLYTGVNPGKHGVFDFLHFEGYDWDVVNATHVREYALWELLDERGLSSVVVNVPITHPPRTFDGALIPGYIAPEDPDCHPPAILDDVRDAVGEYTVYPPGELSDRTREETIAGYRTVAEMRGEAFCYLASRFDPEFGFVQFQQTDTVFHQLPSDDEAVRAAYEAVDEQLGRILDDCDPDTVVVASDHGIGEYAGYEFRVNEFLKNRGYAETTRGGDSLPSWSSVLRNNLMTGEAAADRDPSLLERTLSLAASVGLTSQRMGAALEAVGLDELALEYVPDDAIRAGTERVSFPESKAYMRSRIECGIRINLEGREPDGEVCRDEYEVFRETLVEELRALRTPDGSPMFDAVEPREAVFDGPYLEDAADVLLVPADYDQYLSSLLLGEEFGQPSQPYNHKLNGIIAASGDAVDASADATDAHLFDVAPTVLATLDVPASDRMDGRALPFVDSAGTASYPDFNAERFAATDDADVERRLTDLGYLE